MDYVDLSRSFVPVRKDQEPSLDLGLAWGRRIGEWLDWSDLLDYRRVVLLAEASSGKTEEFRHQADVLSAEGKAAFFIAIEDLADEDMAACLDPSAIPTLERWCQSVDEEAWFFLDSVDEARLNHKSIDRALRHCSQAVDRGVDRAHIYISCRVSDWRGDEDRAAVTRRLPVPLEPPALEVEDAEAALLAPLFKDEHELSGPATAPEPEREKADLLIVQLVPLSAEQWQCLASAAGVAQPDTLVREIEQNGADTLTERPGDLLDLIEYWRQHGSLGSLAEMTEHGVTRKLVELNRFRPDNTALSPEKARRGAERIAAALILTKSTNLRAPGHEADPTLSPGALDPAGVLGNWTGAERNALTRRGLFAPSTYGRVRFHHRGTQEYLTAAWLHRLLHTGCPRGAVWKLLFAEPHGVETLVPSLAAPAAWLALHHPDVRDEILRREPLVLLRHGDPRALPLDVKKRLLLDYAQRHAVGEITDDDVDNRALSMFATPGLSETICRCWDINRRTEFRADLLRLIREGPIHGCIDLARSAVTDLDGKDYQQIVALQALDACEDADGLAAAARWLMAAKGRSCAGVAAGFAQVLFPRHLTVDELLQLVARSPEPRCATVGDFAYCIEDLWKQCPAGAERERFLLGLAELVLAPPFESDHRPVSAAHHDLAKKLVPVARDAVLTLGDSEPSQGLLRLLVAVERAGQLSAGDQECPTLVDLVRSTARLQRQLFWADVAATHQGPEGRLTRFWHSLLRGESLWRLGLNDLEWLHEDIAHRADTPDRQIALSATVEVLRDAGLLQVLHLSADQRQRATRIARRRIRAIRGSDGDGRLPQYVTMLFVVDPAGATRELVDWLQSVPARARDRHAAGALATLFSRHHGIAPRSVATAPVAVLETLVRLAYQHVRPEDDRIHEGAYTPDTRDRAQEARNAVPGLSLDRPGIEAYQAVRALAADTSFAGLSTRLAELAHGKAECDAEIPAWTPADVVGFERSHISPAQTGHALLRVVVGVLQDVQSSFSQADATSRPLLERAEDEEEVQAWLAEQMNARARGRYHAHREAQVAQGDKPDMIVSSTAAAVEVAMEVKHGGKNWTVRNFERALTRQLAEKYLRPPSRRWGVLAISHHGRRTWRHPETHEMMTFHDVIQHLQVLAGSVDSNTSGPIEVRAFGIDASPLDDS